jgi:hypothetical protein
MADETPAAEESRDYLVQAEVVTVYRGTVRAASVADANAQVARMVEAGELDDLTVVETRTRQTSAHEVVSPPESQ